MPEVFKRHPLLVLLLVALTLRVAAAVGIQAYLDRTHRTFLIAGDAEGYWMLAGQIAAGQPYAVYDPPRRVLRMPGFPLLLAATRAVSHDSFLVTRLVLAIVGTATCGAVYLLGVLLGSSRLGLIAAGLAACWPVLIGFSVLVLSETLFGLLLTVSLAAMAWLWKRCQEATATGGLTRKGFGGAVLVGATVVLASYVRPTWLPAAGLFPLAYWFSKGRTKSAALVAITILLAAAATLAPWTVRNRIATGHWVPTTLWVGPSLYDGLSETATGESDMRFFDEEQLLSRMSEFDMDQEYRRRSWEFVRDNPVRTIELAFMKLWRYVRPWPGAEQFSSPAASLLVAGYYIPMIVLAGFGMWELRNDLWFIGLTTGPFLLFALVHCVFVSSLRYRLPAEYPLCLLSAAGIQSLFYSYTGRMRQISA